MFTNPTQPNLTDFITFCQAQGVEAGFLPVTSDYYVWGLQYAENIVINVPQIPAIQYVIAVYNLGMHWLVTNAPDVRAANASLTWATGTVTATTAAPLDLTIGETFPVTITAAVPTGYNGPYSATVTGTSTFTYLVATNPGTETAAGFYNLQFFSDLRKKFNLLAFSAGPINSSADNGTSESTVVSDVMKQLTFSDLEVMLTPWGRKYLAFAQMYGPNIVEFS